MQQCMTDSLELSNAGMHTLTEIRKTLENHRLAAALFASGNVGKLFSNKPTGTAIKMTRFDWVRFAEAAGQFEAMARHSVQKQALTRYMDARAKPGERKFWMCVYSAFSD